jgi:predicted polyphosphate/ATP-dependent NAD kinase
MATVGIIANPAAGKDIRRLVAQGRFIPNQEKVNVVKRVLAGLGSLGVKRVLMMRDSYGIGVAAGEGLHQGIELQILEMPVFNEERDSTRAADLMARDGVGCIVTLGGDGTNRVVAKASGNIPLIPISTGTNNVFSQPVEGTVAGLAAAVVARGLVDLDSVTTVHNILEVQIEGRPPDIALVDVAVSKETFVGARAIWDVRTLDEVFLARSVPGSIGLSAIGALLSPSSTDDGSGLRLRIGQGGTSVLAPVAPGMISSVPVQSWAPLPAGEPVEVSLHPCTIALDGERTFSLLAGQAARITLSRKGPPVVSVEAALRHAAQAGVFTSEYVDNAG